MFWKKWKSLFKKGDISQVIKIEKELISIDPHSFDGIEDYLAHVKELELKLGEYGKKLLKKDGQLIKLVLMNMRTPYDVLCSLVYTN